MLLKKLNLDYSAEILLLLQSILDFTYMACKGLLCGIFAHLESHHIELKSFATLHKLNHRITGFHWHKTFIIMYEVPQIIDVYKCVNFNVLKPVKMLRLTLTVPRLGVIKPGPRRVNLQVTFPINSFIEVTFLASQIKHIYDSISYLTK